MGARPGQSLRRGVGNKINRLLRKTRNVGGGERRELDAVNKGDICQFYSWHRAKGTLLLSAAQKERGSAPGRHLQCLTRDAWRDGGRENGGVQGLIADSEGSEGAKESVEVQYDGKYLPIIHRCRYTAYRCVQQCN